MAALRYYRARQRAERSAAMLAALADVSLHINAAETFDGLAAARRRPVPPGSSPFPPS